MKRIISIMLSLVMILGVIPAATAFAEEKESNVKTTMMEATATATQQASDEALWEAMWDQYYAEHPEALKAADTSVRGVRSTTETTLSAMRARAEALVNYKWTPSKKISTWNGNSYNGKNYFPAGSTVTGVPYTLFTWEFNVRSLCSLNQYKAVASKNYSDTTYCNSVGATRTGPVYGSCCADLVSEVFGGSYMSGDTIGIHSVGGHWKSELGTTVKNQKMSDIRPGDAVSDSGQHHIIWVGYVTDSTITIYEQTPPVAVKKVLNKSQYTDAYGNFIYNGATYNVITRSKAFIDDSNPFVDVNENAPYYQAVMWAVQNGITSGTDATHFSPNLTVKRCDALVFLWATKGRPGHTVTDNPFVDVKPSDWYYNAVMWAYENGYAAGTDATHFKPKANCDRSQALQFLYAAAGKPNVNIGQNHYSDVSNQNWYWKCAVWAYLKNLETGENGMFNATTPCSRADIVTYLYKLYK